MKKPNTKPDLPDNALTDWMPIRGRAETTLYFRDDDHVAESTNLLTYPMARTVALSESARTNYEWGIEELTRLYRSGWVCTLVVSGKYFCIVREA